MKVKTTLLLAVLFIGFCSNAMAQQTAQVTPSKIGYLEYLPEGYSANKNRYPLVISLHGIGEKGTSSTDVNAIKESAKKVANAGLPRYVKNGTKYPFILISPQLKSSQSRWTGAYVMDVINYVKKTLRVDNSRIYLTGLSLGGGGVWSVLSEYPDFFAAVVPICSGYSVVSAACKIASADVPVWAFHGDRDYTVSYRVSEKMINAINACSPQPSPRAKFTIFPGMGHNTWDRTYKETSALTWMLGYKKGNVSADEDNDEDEDVNSSAPNKLPVVNAGGDKTITLPTRAITLVGSASDPDGKVASYRWTKISGPGAPMLNTTTRKLWAYNLVAGTYVYRLTAKDNDGGSRYDDVKLTVREGSASANKAPVVNAGGDKVIELPRRSITLVGSAFDPDGTIASYRWTQISGARAPISHTSTRKLWAYDLKAGTYIFRLTVKDNDGTVRSDDVKLIVRS